MNSQQEDEIISLSKQKWDWMSAQDVAPLDALFNEVAVFVHMGATFSKEEKLDVIKTGYIHDRDVDIKDVSVRFIWTAAIVLTTLQLGFVVDGKEVTNPFVVTEVYVREADEWATATQACTRLDQVLDRSRPFFDHWSRGRSCVCSTSAGVSSAKQWGYGPCPRSSTRIGNRSRSISSTTSSDGSRSA
jgi:hypothetical protein